MDTSFEANELLAVIDEGKKSEWPTPTKRIADFPPQRTHPRLSEPPKSRPNARPTAIPKLDLLKSKINRKSAEVKLSSHLSPVLEGTNESSLSPEKPIEKTDVLVENIAVVGDTADASYDVESWPMAESIVDRQFHESSIPVPSSSSSTVPSSSSSSAVHGKPSLVGAQKEPPKDETRSKETLILLSRVDNVLSTLDSVNAAPVRRPFSTDSSSADVAPKSHHLTSFLDEQIDYLLAGVPEVLEEAEIDDDELERLINGTSLYLGQPRYENSAPHEETQLNLRIQLLNLGCNSVHRGLKTTGSFLVLHPPADCRCFVSLRPLTLELPDLTPPSAQMLGMPGFTRSQKYHSLRHYFVGDVNLENMSVLLELTDNPQKLIMESEGHKLEMRLDLFSVTEEPALVRGMPPNLRAPIRIGSCFVDIAPALMDPSTDHLMKVKMRVDEVTAPVISKRLDILTAGLPQLQRQKQQLGNTLLGTVTLQVRAVPKREPERVVFDGTLLAQSDVHQALDCVPVESRPVAPAPEVNKVDHDFVAKSSFSYPSNQVDIDDLPDKESLLASLGSIVKPAALPKEVEVPLMVPAAIVERSVSPDPFLDEVVHLLNDKTTSKAPSTAQAVTDVPAVHQGSVVSDEPSTTQGAASVPVVQRVSVVSPALLLDVSVDGLCGLLHSTDRFQAFNGCSIYYSFPPTSASASPTDSDGYCTLWWDAVSAVFNSTCRHRIKQQDAALNLTSSNVGQSIEFLVCLTDLLSPNTSRSDDSSGVLLFGVARLPLVGLTSYLKSQGPDTSFALPISILDSDSVLKNNFEFRDGDLSVNIRLSCRMEPALLSTDAPTPPPETNAMTDSRLSSVLRQQRDQRFASSQIRKGHASGSGAPTAPALSPPSTPSVSTPALKQQEMVASTAVSSPASSVASTATPRISKEVQKLFDLTYAADPTGFGSFYELHPRTRDGSSTSDDSAIRHDQDRSGSLISFVGESDSSLSVMIEELMPSLLDPATASFPEHLLQSHLFCTVSLSKPNRQSCSSPSEAHDAYLCTPLHSPDVFDAQRPPLHQSADWMDECILTLTKEHMQQQHPLSSPHSSQSMLGVVVTLYARRPLFLGLGGDFNSFIGLGGDKVHPVRITDIPVGRAVVDLSTITQLGASEICGWYHLLNDLQRTVGQVKVRINLIEENTKKPLEEEQLTVSVGPSEGGEQPCLQVEYSEELRQLDYEALFRSLHDLDLVRAKLLNQNILKDDFNISESSGSDDDGSDHEASRMDDDEDADSQIDFEARSEASADVEAVEDSEGDRQPEDLVDEEDDKEYVLVDSEDVEPFESTLVEVQEGSESESENEDDRNSEDVESDIDENDNDYNDDAGDDMKETEDVEESLNEGIERGSRSVPDSHVSEIPEPDCAEDIVDIPNSSEDVDVIDAQVSDMQDSVVEAEAVDRSRNEIEGVEDGVSERQSSVIEPDVEGSVRDDEDCPAQLISDGQDESDDHLLPDASLAVSESEDLRGDDEPSSLLEEVPLVVPAEVPSPAPVEASFAHSMVDASTCFTPTDLPADSSVDSSSLLIDSSAEEESDSDDCDGDTVVAQPQTTSVPFKPEPVVNVPVSSSAAKPVAPMNCVGLLSEKPLKLSLAQIRAVSAARTISSGSSSNSSGGGVLNLNQLKILEDSHRISKVMARVINGTVPSL